MKFALQYFKPINNRPHWIKTMVEIGPQLTSDPNEALEFDSREDALLHPAFAHPTCLVEVVPSPKQALPVHRVEWMQLTGEPIQCGDFWASHDPNAVHQQGYNSFNLQMQAVHPSIWGRSASDQVANVNSGAYWRPVQIVDYVAHTYEKKTRAPASRAGKRS